MLQMQKPRPSEVGVGYSRIFSRYTCLWLHLVFAAGSVLIGRSPTDWLVNVLTVVLVTQLDGGGRIQTLLEPRCNHKLLSI